MLSIKILTLIIEDDPMVSNINKRFLKQNSAFQLIGIANNGTVAMEYIEKQDIDLLLLDIYMPKLNGMELLRNIRSEEYKIDVILITAANSHEEIEEAMRLGVVDCILKPFTNNRFQRALNMYIKRHLLFRSQDNINQKEFDSLQNKIDRSNQTDGVLPKGLDNFTLNLIRQTLQSSDNPLSAKDLFDQIKLSRITARKYLEYLVENTEISLDLKYSKIGRPTKLYYYGQNQSIN